MVEKNIEEILELIWLKQEAGQKAISDIKNTSTLIDEHTLTTMQNMLSTMQQEGYVIEKKEGFILSEEGQKLALGIIRRHRLAERLLHDVLDLSTKVMESNACTFEHILSPEVTEAICVLLGHPRECPHGRPIPPGECCLKAQKEVSSLIVPLSELKAGTKAKVSHITTCHHARLDRLSSLGLFPGVEVTVHQTFPSYVIQVGETHIALDKEILDDIFVRQK